ncbi:MAG: 50S ribosomal protein L22 [Armatimonadetes bacterium]|nr:50S ribosomal protein L22 [Armatimonadota bacterium]
MEVKATAKYVRVQPRKVRIVADEVKGMPVSHAANKLRYHSSKGAYYLRRVLVSAVANAAENNNLAPEGLKIARIEVNEGPHIKRIQARSMGRANRILKKTSHITVVVEEFEPQAAVKPHGTKAKPRPTFGSVKAKKKTEAKAAPVEEAAPVVEETPAVEAVEETVVEQADAPATEETPAASEGTSEESTEN